MMITSANGSLRRFFECLSLNAQILRKVNDPRQSSMVFIAIKYLEIVAEAILNVFCILKLAALDKVKHLV